MITIRPLEAGDVDALWNVFQGIIRDGTTYVHDEATTRASFEAYWCGRGGEQWVATDDGQVLGSYTLLPNHPGRGSHVATAGYIVAEHARGRGVGLLMGEHSLVRAKAAGFAAVQFNFVVGTNESAIRLWKRLGFEIVGTMPKAFRHATAGFVDAHVMFRRLD